MIKRPNTTSVKFSNELKKFVESSNKSISYGDLLEIGYNTIAKNNNEKQLYHYKKKIKELKQEKAFIEIEIEGLEETIKELEKNKDSKNSSNLLSDKSISVIKTVITKYLNKKIQYHNISEFLDDNEELIYLHSNNTKNDAEDYKKLVIEYYDKNYD
jgi:hypothetical protein